MLALTESGGNSPLTFNHTTTLQRGLQENGKCPKVASTYCPEPSQLQNHHFPPLSPTAHVLKVKTATQNASTDSGVPQLVGRKCRVRRLASVHPPYLRQRTQPTQPAWSHAEVNGLPMEASGVFSLVYSLSRRH